MLSGLYGRAFQTSVLGTFPPRCWVFWNQKWPYLDCLHKLCRYKEQTHIFVRNRLIRYWNFTDSTFIIGLSVPHSKPHYLSEKLPASPTQLGRSVQWVEVMATASSYSCIILRLQTPNLKIASKQPSYMGWNNSWRFGYFAQGSNGTDLFFWASPKWPLQKMQIWAHLWQLYFSALDVAMCCKQQNESSVQ